MIEKYIILFMRNELMFMRLLFIEYFYLNQRKGKLLVLF